MKAALFIKPGKIEVVNRNTPKPQNNDVLLQIDYAGICGTDKKIFNGEIKSKPVILGHEFSGRAVKLGSKARGIKIGKYYNVQPNLSCGQCYLCKIGKNSLCEKKVSYGIHLDGGFAEYCLVDYRQLYPIGNIAPLESIFLEPVACCLHGLDRCNLSSVKNVLIIGGGFIGLIFVQLARLKGLNISVVEPNNDKRRLSLKLGANRAFRSIAEIDKKINYDLVIEAVGKKKTIEASFRYVGKGGQVLLFGVAPEECQVLIKPFRIFEKELMIISSRSNGHDHSRALAILPKLDIKNLITDFIPLRDISRVFKLMHQPSTIKVILRLKGEK